MKKQLVALTLSLTIGTSAFAACLDSKPSSQAELNKEIRIAKSELAINRDNQKLFEDIALSAKKRSAVAKLIASGSALPLSFVIGGAVATSTAGANAVLAAQGMGGTAAGLLAEFGIVLGPLVADGTVSVNSLRQIISKQGFNSKETEELITAVEINNTRGCSYLAAQEKVDELRDEVLATDLNGSLKHNIIDHLTLGSLSKRATEKLFHLAAYKTLLSEQKLKELQKIKL